MFINYLFYAFVIVTNDVTIETDNSDVTKRKKILMNFRYTTAKEHVHAKILILINVRQIKKDTSSHYKTIQGDRRKILKYIIFPLISNIKLKSII